MTLNKEPGVQILGPQNTPHHTHSSVQAVGGQVLLGMEFVLREEDILVELGHSSGTCLAHTVPVLKRRKALFLYVFFCLHVFLYHIYALCTEARRCPLGLELQMVVICYVGAGIRTLVLQKGNHCS